METSKTNSTDSDYGIKINIHDDLDIFNKSKYHINILDFNGIYSYKNISNKHNKDFIRKKRHRNKFIVIKPNNKNKNKRMIFFKVSRAIEQKNEKNIKKRDNKYNIKENLNKKQNDIEIIIDNSQFHQNFRIEIEKITQNKIIKSKYIKYQSTKCLYHGKFYKKTKSSSDFMKYNFNFIEKLKPPKKIENVEKQTVNLNLSFNNNINDIYNIIPLREKRMNNNVKYLAINE